LLTEEFSDLLGIDWDNSKDNKHCLLARSNVLQCISTI
jgi:hypothetical protein